MSVSTASKEKVILIFSGSLFGALLLGLVWILFPNVFAQLALPEGAKFENLADLRKSMTERDSRDIQADGSVSLRSIVIPNDSDQIIYELKPGLAARFMHVPVKMNALGMRGPETTLEKPANTFRVALLGDSYTFGWGVEQDKTFASLMQKTADTILNGTKKVEVLNFGVPGYATFQEVGLFFEKALKFSPDAVLIYVISNDFGLPFFIKDLQTGSALVSATEFDKAKISPADADAWKRRGKMFDLLDSNKALKRLITYCASHKLPLFVVFHPDKRADQTENRFWVLNLPKLASSFTRWDISPDFDKAVEAGEVPKESLRIPGDNHPGPGAHQIIGRLLGERIAAFVKSID